MVWRKGDLGRFLSEDPKRPRFELLGTAIEDDGKRVVNIWYSGEEQPRSFPWALFKRDAINIWENQAVNPHAMHPWMEPEGAFFLYPAGRYITTATIAPDPHSKKRRAVLKHTVDVGNQMLTIRQIRFDHASCLLEDGRLVLVPLESIRRWGYRLQTAWERLMEDDEDEIDEDLFEGL